MLRCFLEDADGKKHTSAMVRNTVKEIKEIVFDAEDIIETFLLEEELGKTSGIKNSVKRFSSVILKRTGIAFNMKAISKRISKVIRDMQSLAYNRSLAMMGIHSLYKKDKGKCEKHFLTTMKLFLLGWRKTLRYWWTIW
uniref:Putative disease resistance protein RDL6 n=1 Tax=Noccaea caerulescens TaxID=107243 RepID=A0A1J3I4Q3_NOCCA